MRVLIVNTSEHTGGAAVAANRLMDALNNNGVKAKMLVKNKESENITVAHLPHSGHLKFLWERWCIYCHLHFHKDHLWDIDIANAGTDITKLREFKEADIIHLSWINQGMLSLKNIRKILQSGKPVVWTMHDLWPATGICHYARGCTRFHSTCQYCPLLPNGGSEHDLAYRIWHRKQALLKAGSIYFVTCSKWLRNQASQSTLLTGLSLTDIPNPIDTHVFFPKDRKESRLRVGLPANKKLILFVSQKVTDERKGMSYFTAAIQKLVEKHPDMKQNTGIVVLGGHSEEIANKLSLPVFPQGYVEDERKIVDIYNSVDVYVLPSLEDNLPNTIMEAMACGIPCVGFRTGGIPEMIDHQKNGYLANFKDVEDLADGIYSILSEVDQDAIRQECRHKVELNYSQHAVAMKYIDIYNQVRAFKHYRL